MDPGLWSLGLKGLWSLGLKYAARYVRIITCCPWSHGLQNATGSFRVPNQFVTCLEDQASHVYQLMIRVRRYRGLCADLLAFTLQLRKTPAKPLLGDRPLMLCDLSSSQIGSLTSK
jgi:hypothetical protein